MVNPDLQSENVRILEAELAWFTQVLEVRARLNSGTERQYRDMTRLSPPSFRNSSSPYAQLVQRHAFTFTERLVIVLAMVPHIRPEILDIFLKVNERTGQVYTEFGGRKSASGSAFLPTGETACFILSGKALEGRFQVMSLFGKNHPFTRERLLSLEGAGPGEPALSGLLRISDAKLRLFTLGEAEKPDFGPDFPARLMETKMTWDDLVLPDQTSRQILQLETWLAERETILNKWGLGRFVGAGFKALFYGKPGTGKTLTATLLGKKTGMDVYRVDLSQVVSKFIGETEKNLGMLFDRAENEQWILFFDEADALFGARTATKDAHDRYANQQISYLLQRIEAHSGMVILASNLKSQIDAAFMRRFQAVIHFPLPDVQQRHTLWKEMLGRGAPLAKDTDLLQLATEFNTSGGTIVNAVQHAMIRTLERGEESIRQQYLVDGIRLEFSKDRKTM